MTCLSSLTFWCFALLLSGVNAGCVNATKAACSADASCVWTLVTAAQCTPPTNADCVLPGCGSGCSRIEAVPGRCITPTCASKAEAACNGACEWNVPPKVCAMPDTIVCSIDEDGYCRGSNGKSSCEFRNLTGACGHVNQAYCTRVKNYMNCEYDYQQGHLSGCKEVDGNCVPDEDLFCEFDPDQYGCTDATRLQGCQAYTIYEDCDYADCETITSGSLIRCKADSTALGCVIVENTGVCVLKDGVNCIANPDGECTEGSSTLCDSAPSEDARCEVDTSIICSVSADGLSCDDPACGFVPEFSRCLDKSGNDGGNGGGNGGGSSAGIVRASSTLGILAVFIALLVLF